MNIFPFFGQHLLVSNSSLPTPLLPNDATVSNFNETFSLPPTNPPMKRYATAGRLRDDKMYVVRHNHVSTDHPIPPIEPCAPQSAMNPLVRNTGNTVLATHRNEIYFDTSYCPDISESEVLPPREKSANDLLVVHDDISVCNVECCAKYNMSVTGEPRGGRDAWW